MRHLAEEAVKRARQHVQFLECLAPEFCVGKTKRVEFCLNEAHKIVARIFIGEMLVDEWEPVL